MKDLSILPEEQRAVILARRAYMAEWRKHNADKIKRHQAAFFLRQAEKANEISGADTAISETDTAAN